MQKDRGWQIETRKLADPRWIGPRGAELVCEVSAPAAESWIGAAVGRRFRSQNSGAFRYYAFLKLPKAGWNTVRFRPSDFQNIYGERLDGWNEVLSLTLGDAAVLANDKERLLPRAGKQAVRAIPTDVSSWKSPHYQANEEHCHVRAFLCRGERI